MISVTNDQVNLLNFINIVSGNRYLIVANLITTLLLSSFHHYIIQLLHICLYGR